LIKFAEAGGYLTKNHLDFSAVARAKEVQTEIEIFKAKEVAALLAAAQMKPAELKAGYNLRYAESQGLLPLLVLGGFAGLRTAEIERQLWEDINVERGFIRVTAAKGNTAQKRLVPISENLKQWLSLCKRESGPVCEIARTPAALTRLAKRAGVKWKHNALRHSYASYRMADIKNAAQVSLELGNSPKMVFRHYRELVTEDEAKEWFGIGPKAPANVRAMPKARKAA
jgi:integrase